MQMNRVKCEITKGERGENMSGKLKSFSSHLHLYTKRSIAAETIHFSME